MCENTLGETFDIHGGGLDLVFPHHENEIAQSVCAHDGRPFARYWLHNGMLTVDGAKMAKSEGNFITVRDILAEAPGEVIRLALLGTHYRDPLDWTEGRLQQARQTLNHFYGALSISPRDEVQQDKAEEEAKPILAALRDDLNTPLALTEFHSLARKINWYERSAGCATHQQALRIGGRMMGLLGVDPMAWRHGIATPPGYVESRIAARAQARRNREFAYADSIRAELAEEGIILEDKPDGTTDWRRA
jgi:cysteinyl-tRNA synthetase